MEAIFGRSSAKLHLLSAMQPLCTTTMRDEVKCFMKYTYRCIWMAWEYLHSVYQSRTPMGNGQKLLDALFKVGINLGEKVANYIHRAIMIRK